MNYRIAAISSAFAIAFIVNAIALMIASPAAASDPLQAMPSAEAGQLKEILANVIRNILPEHYENDKDWGHTKRVYAGVKLHRDGWKLKTHRRWKDLNQGAWTRYSIDLIDPDRTVQTDLHYLNWLPDGSAEFELSTQATMRCMARRSRWNLGVQLWSFSLEADATVRLTLKGTIGLGMDPSKVPPDVLIQPAVQQATIDVPHFEVNRISRLGGDAAEAIGDTMEGLFRDAIVNRQETKLVDKINRQIGRNEKNLRLSMSDWLTNLLSTPQPKAATELEAGAKADTDGNTAK